VQNWVSTLTALFLKEKRARMALPANTAGPALTSQLFVLRHWEPTTHGLQERILKCAERTGIAVRAHRLRHTIAIQLINVEMPVTSLQRFLGHEGLDKTMIYAQFTDPTLVAITPKR
jgi:site-specific recombinase XerD